MYLEISTIEDFIEMISSTYSMSLGLPKVRN